MTWEEPALVCGLLVFLFQPFTLSWTSVARKTQDLESTLCFLPLVQLAMAGEGHVPAVHSARAGESPRAKQVFGGCSVFDDDTL